MGKEITRETASSLKTGAFLVLYHNMSDGPEPDWRAIDSGPVLYVTCIPRTIVMWSTKLGREIKLGYDKEYCRWRALHPGLLDELCSSDNRRLFLVKQDKRRLPIPPAQNGNRATT